MPNPRPTDPDYRAGIACDHIRRRAQQHIAAGRASRAVAVLDRALALAGRYSPQSDTCRRLRRDLHPLWNMAFAADEGQDRIRRELVSYHTTAAGDIYPDGYRMQA